MANYTLNIENMNPNIKIMEYAVRGPLAIRAGEIEKELEKGVEKPFNGVIRANLGDSQAMGQIPITFVRQVLALCIYPSLLESSEYSIDVKKRANDILKASRGGSVGSYSDSAGLEIIRRHVADYIEKRDGGIPSDWQNIVLSSGATEGIKSLIKLFVCENDKFPGVMIPIPQYPLYSAILTEFNITQIEYYLDEENQWALDILELKRSIEKARCKGINPRALVVINPGNPTGQVLTRHNIEEIIKFAYNEKLFLLADEVYQFNVYASDSKFYSFKMVMTEMGQPYKNMELASFMSCSKGYMGECGLRGGYTEVVNMSPEVKAMYLKSISISLCPNVLGQVCIDTLVNPPQEGEPSYKQFFEEKQNILKSLKLRSRLVVDTFNSLEGLSCNEVQGAMYAFPQIKLPPKIIEAAKSKNQSPDVYYAFELLDSTGVCIIPGSGFLQKPGTFHFRTTILPQLGLLEDMLTRIGVFHKKFLNKYK